MTAVYQTQIEEVREALRKEDGIVIVPTDTTYRIVCRLDRPFALQRLSQLVPRDQSRPLVVLGAHPGYLFAWVTDDVTWPILIAKNFWPGPVTLIARASDRVPAGILGGGSASDSRTVDPTIALRMPRHEPLFDMLSQLPGKSVVSARVPLAGERAISFEAVSAAFKDKVDYVMEDCGTKPSGAHSTVVDVSKDEPKVLREGAVSTDKIVAIVNKFRRD